MPKCQNCEVPNRVVVAAAVVEAADVVACGTVVLETIEVKIGYTAAVDTLSWILAGENTDSGRRRSSCSDIECTSSCGESSSASAG